MVGAFVVTEINYLVASLFCDLVRPPFSFIFVLLNSLAALFALFLTERKKRLWSFPKSFMIF